MKFDGEVNNLARPPHRRIAALLKIQPGETRLVARLATLYFILALSFVFVQSMAFGLFVAEYGPDFLPYSYISIAVVATLLAVVYLKLGERLSFPRLLKLNLLFTASICFLVWLGLLSPVAHYVAFLLPLLFQVLLNLSNLVIWPLAGRLMDIQQGKRLFGLVGAGLWLANIIGGLFVPFLVRRIGSVNLLLLAVFSILAAFFLLRRLLLAYRHSLESAAAPSPRTAASPPPTRWRPDAYILTIFGYTALWWAAFYFVDNIFFNRLSAQISDADQLTAFMGAVLSVTGLLAFITTTFLTSRLIALFGLRFGLIAMPLLVTACAGLLAFGGSLNAPALAIFGLSVSLKLLNVALGFSLSQSANAIVYQSLSERIRPRVQTTAEGIVQPLAIGSAGLLLAGLTAVLGFGYVGLSFVLLGLGLVWILAILYLNRGYVPALTKTINHRRLGESPLQINDPVMLALLRDHLSDPQPGAALYSLAQLEQFDQQVLLASLPALITHPSAEVRREAFLRIERYSVVEALPHLTQQLAVEADPLALEAGLLALGAISGGQADSLLSPYLESSDPPAVRGALTAFLKYHDSPAARQRFDHLLDSEIVSHRLMAAHILGRLALPGLDQACLRLLDDPSQEVRLSMLQSAARQPRASLVKPLLAACDSPHTSRLAVSALAGIGEPALPEIENALSEAASPELRTISLAQVLGDIGGAASIALLLTRLEAPDPVLRSQVLQSLSKCRYHSSDPTCLKELVETEAHSIAWTCAALRDLSPHQTGNPLPLALNQHLTQARQRLLLLLSFLLDRRSILAASEALASEESSNAAYAVEIIESQLPSGWSRFVLPALNLSNPADVLLGLAPLYPQPVQPAEARLQAIIDSSPPGGFTPWVRACAGYATRSISLQPPTSRKVEAFMLSTVEKVLILKSVGMFSQTPDDVLADVAGLLVEVDASPSQPLITLGEQGDSLYVIVDGRVQVHDGDRLLSYLGPREVFGEMALLDPEPRMASVTAIEPTRLFRLDQSAFYQLISERPEVSIGILRVLSSRLRDLTRRTAVASPAVNLSSEPLPTP